MRSHALLFSILLLAPLGAQADNSPAAAEVTLTTGAVSASSGGGASRSLGSGDPVYAGDTVHVGPNSYANLHFADGARVLLRPDSDFTIESYKYAGGAAGETAKEGAAAEAGAGEAFFSLLRGGFRAISGLIGKADRKAYRVKTPVATIGIRGTDYEVQTCAADCPTEGLPKASSDSTLVAAAGPVQLADAAAGETHGVVVATNAGSVSLTTPKGEFAVDAGQVALTVTGGQTFMLPVVPDVLLRHHTPSPENCN